MVFYFCKSNFFLPRCKRSKATNSASPWNCCCSAVQLEIFVFQMCNEKLAAHNIARILDLPYTWVKHICERTIERSLKKERAIEEIPVHKVARTLISYVLLCIVLWYDISCYPVSMVSYWTEWNHCEAEFGRFFLLLC